MIRQTAWFCQLVVLVLHKQYVIRNIMINTPFHGPKLNFATQTEIKINLLSHMVRLNVRVPSNRARPINDALQSSATIG